MGGWKIPWSSMWLIKQLGSIVALTISWNVCSRKILTCSSCCETGCNWQRQGAHRTPDPVRRRSELLHQSIPQRVDDDDERCTLSHEVCIKIMATWKFNAEVKESLAKLHPLTYCSAKQFLPIRFEIEHHAPPGPWQSGPTDEQHQEDQIGKGSSHPNYLMQTRGKTKQLFSPVSLVILDNHMVSLVKHMLDCNADDFLWTSLLVWYEGSKSVQQNQRCYFYCTHSFPC